MNAPSITVAIPVYNGEKYIAETLDSLLQQEFENFEVICVDDGSSDSSPDILHRYAARDSRVRVLSPGRNLGSAPRALNFLLPHVKGQRFAYASQDDLFSRDWLAKTFLRSQETGADAVLPELEFYYPGRCGNTALVGLRGDKSPILSNNEALCESLDWSVHGFALWNTNLVRRVGFYDFSSHADEYTSRVLFYHCNKVVFSAGRFYYRQDNPDAITKKFSVHSFDAPRTSLMLFRFLVEHGVPEPYCGGELLKTVSSLLWHRQQLALYGESLRCDDREEAKRRLSSCFAELNSSEILPHVKRLRRRGLIAFLKASAVSSGYRFFETTSAGAAGLQRVRDWWAAERVRS